MTLTETAAGTHSTGSDRPSLQERARELAPAIAQRAYETDQQRFVHAETVQAMVDAGLTRALQPAAYGGEEANPADFIRAVIEIGRACTSAAWVLMLTGVHNWEIAHMTDQAQNDVFADDPTTLVSSSYAAHGTAEKVDGGFRLTGRWKSSSGVLHAKWSILGAVAETSAGPRMQNFLVDLKDAQIVDDWFVLGVRGSGSRSVQLDGAFVPNHRILDRDVLLAQLGPGLTRNTAPLYKVPQGYIYSLVAGAPAVGAAWGFYDEFKAQLKKVTRRFDDAALSQERVQLIRLTDARVVLSDQQEAILHLLDDAYERAVLGKEHTPLELGQGIYDAARTAAAALHVAQTLFPSLSAAAVYETNPLQRQYRDLIVARQHFTQNTDFAAATAANLELENPITAAFLLTPERRLDAERIAAEIYR